jgi:uncharacterized membrane protein YkvA (DUF1232 family)
MGIISRIKDWLTTPYTIYLILRDPAIPRPIKLRAIIGLVLIFAYILSPFDLIPDFIPFAGWLDDILIVPLGLTVLREITPGFNILEKRERAQAGVKRVLLWAALFVVVVIVLGLLWLGILIYLIVRLIAG